MRLGMDVRIRFHGVGQGLFSSGSICPLPKSGGSEFNWVYDFGTDSAQHYLDSSLRDLEPRSVESESISSLLSFSLAESEVLVGASTLILHPRHDQQPLEAPCVPQQAAEGVESDQVQCK